MGWEKVYERENKNFGENGDEGEVWFGEEAMGRMVRVLDKMAQNEEIQYKSPIIDLGTGNGVLLRELDEYGFTDLTGVDYAAGSVQLAANICKDLSTVTIEQADIL